MATEISLLNFNYKKISIQKVPEFNGKIEINQNINISSIEKQELKLLKQDALKVIFSYDIKYNELADINLDGEIILKADSKTLKETLSGWKNKSLNPEIQTIILNLIIQKASIKAIELEEEMGLPIHIQIPRLEVSKKE
jgi:hypothetical protein